MPIASRPRDFDRQTNGRKFRDVADFKRRNGNGNGNAPVRPLKASPPEITNAESFYYLKQMNAKTPMVIVLTDGEQVHGWIEWYDRNCLKVNREGAPNLLIQKHCIKYLFKEEEVRPTT